MRIFNSFKRKAPAEVAVHIIVSAIFMLVALSYLYIFAWAIIAGLRTNSEIVVNPYGMPKIWHWENYRDVFSMLEVNGNNFLDMLFNSEKMSAMSDSVSQDTSGFGVFCIVSPSLILLVFSLIHLYLFHLD